MIKEYYYLTKPGIIYGNALTATAGFFLASRGQFDWGLFLAMLVGISLVIASGCVFNNYLDRHLDARMDRTKNRALVTGRISNRHAIMYGIVLGLVGIKLLVWFANFLTAAVAITGFLFYVVIYGYVKRRSVFGTIVGSIAGAVPPVVGYTAVSNSLDIGAWILFVILVFWQMPHFYAISIFRKQDYEAATIPVLSVVKGVKTTKLNILFYIFAFVVATTMLPAFGYAGWIYLCVMLTVGLYWLLVAYLGLRTDNHEVWARKVFRVSLIVLLVFNLSIVFDSVYYLIRI